MKARYITESQLIQALENVNTEHGYKLEFKRYPEKTGNFLNFTIKSEASKIAGASISWSGRNSPAASWHAHGYLFDEMIAIAPGVDIRSMGKVINADGGNWNDYNVGSMMSPMYASEGSIL